jgi:hypothetical protein
MKPDGIIRQGYLAILRFLDSRATAWGVGVIMPVIMVLLDPVVFQGGTIGFEQAILGPFRTACYLGIATAIGALATVLITGRGAAFLSGAMVVAAAFGLALGLVLLPFSLLGILFLGVGLLGLSPFLAAAVFARWSLHAFRGSNASHRRASALLGALVFFGMLVGTQVAIAHVLQAALDDILSGRLSKARAATERLKLWRPLVDMDQFIPAWTAQSDPEAKQRLAEAYLAITGENLAERAMRVAD